MNKLPISAVVVSCNEGHLLDDCLRSIRFCKEILVVDLESTDDTRKIASQYTDQIIPHKRVPVVEYIRVWIPDKVSHDWILFVDPDEVYQPKLIDNLYELFSTDLSRVGSIEMPWKFFFGSHPLTGTMWGGKQYKRGLRNKKNNQFIQQIHFDKKVLEGYEVLRIEHEEGVFIHHKWMQNYRQLVCKHIRYLPEEVKLMKNRGKVYKNHRAKKEAIKEFKKSFFKLNGYKDGIIGFGLSLFWTWYTYQKWARLKEIQEIE